MLLVLKGRLKVLNTPYLVYSHNKQYWRLLWWLLFKGGVNSRAASDLADTVYAVFSTISSYYAGNIFSNPTMQREAPRPLTLCRGQRSYSNLEN